LTLSVQVAVVQAPPEQMALTQSVPAVQALVATHRLQLLVPPQSVSLSPPFLTLSLHAAVAQMPPVQTPLPQSVPNVQILPAAHGVQLPPQSMSVSEPFFTVSEQPAVWQTELEQIADVQSVAAAHALPTPHLVAQVAPVVATPPQSTSVSVPFFTASGQTGALQRELVQTPLTQSAPAEHPEPVAHRFAGAQLPPQSIAVSVPFFTVSPQVAV
jgi:hypothetical protein